jgi:hypothetical protein
VQSDLSAENNREDRRLARHAIRRATARGAGEDRRSRRLHRGHRLHDSIAETGHESGNLVMAGFELLSGWPEAYWTPAPAVTVEGPGISLSGYPILLEEELEDLVEYPAEWEIGDAL